MGIIQIAKANLVDDPYNKIQLQTELGIYIHIFSIKSFSAELVTAGNTSAFAG